MTSVRTTPVAVSGPESWAVRVNVTLVPSAGVGFETDFVIETLAPVVGVTLAEAEVVPVGFGFVWVSLAVLVIVPELAFTVTAKVAETWPSATARLPIVQVMVEVPAL